MRSRFWLAVTSLALGLVILAPSLTPLSGSMDAFSDELANGTFQPFGPAFRKARFDAFSGSLGGFTGRSEGNYVPGAGEVPPSWLMDRNGRGGEVVVDYVFNPALGSMKRLKAYDAVGEDGTTLEVADKRLRPAQADPYLRYDRIMEASFEVQLTPGEPVPIYSPHPKAVLTSYRAEPAVPNGLSFFRDGADTLHVVGQSDKRVSVNLTFLTSNEYYQEVPEARWRMSDYAAGVRPEVPAALREEADVVLARAGVEDPDDVVGVIRSLNAYFRSFTEGEIPSRGEVDSLYLALALGGHGCCRHRAFAYMVTAQAVGIPTRVVVNEAHAFVEVLLPDNTWRQVNLGGCGTYEVNNPRNLPSFLDAADDPRSEANPDEDRPVPSVVTFTNITASPARITKGETYFVNGTVEGPGGVGVPGARVDVYLNETKDAPGRLTGAGSTDADGFFSIPAKVPGDLPARGYQLVARSADMTAGALRYEESWSDPPVDVFTPTRILMANVKAAAGFPANLTGRLVDVDNNAVAGARIAWTADGRAQPPLTTDRAGRFQGNVTLADVGNHTLELRYAGDTHHGPSGLVASVLVDRGAILLPTEAPTLARGREGALSGTLAVAGASLGGREVALALVANGSAGGERVVARAVATTSSSGHFVAPVDLPARLEPGVYRALYRVESLDLGAEGLVRVAIEPTLAVEAPSGVAPDETWVVVASLRSDTGAPIAGGIVEIAFDGNASTTQALLTNSTGVARFTVPPGLAVGERRLAVQFPGDEVHAAAELVVPVEVVPPLWSIVPAWAYALAALAVAALAGLAVLARSGRMRRLMPAAARRAPTRSIRLAFPEHGDLPPVAEPDAPLHVEAWVHDAAGRPVTGWVTLLAADRRFRGRARAGQPARFEIPPQPEGVIVLRAHGVGWSRWRTAPTSARVPVASYRRAVEEGYIALRAAAKLDPSATPGDLLRTLAPHLDAVSLARLERAARLFEVADYSEERVDRAFYHEFSRARVAVERKLGEAPHAAA